MIRPILTLALATLLVTGPTPSDEVFQLNERARTALEQGKITDAVQLLESAQRLDPDDPVLSRLHRATTGRGAARPEIVALAFDHRAQFARWAADAGAGDDRIAACKALIAVAARRGAGERSGLGGLRRRGKFGSDGVL